MRRLISFFLFVTFVGIAAPSTSAYAKAKKKATPAKAAKAQKAAKEIKASPTRSTATADIQETERSAQAVASWMISFGAGGLGGLAADGAGISLRTAFVHDEDDYQALLFGDLTVGGTAFFTGLGLGANYFLGHGATAAYVGADLGYGAVKRETGTLLAGQSTAGLAAGATLGLQTWRRSRVHLDLGARLGVLLVKGPEGNPYTVTLRFGVYF